MLAKHLNSSSRACRSGVLIDLVTHSCWCTVYHMSILRSESTASMYNTLLFEIMNIGICILELHRLFFAYHL